MVAVLQLIIKEFQKIILREKRDPCQEDDFQVPRRKADNKFKSSTRHFIVR